MKTINELYLEALAVQDASNLSGVAQRFAAVMIELGHHTNGTDERNKHLIVSLWLDKMVSLNQYTDDKVSDAYNIAHQIKAST